jgi:hypothetical protein
MGAALYPGFVAHEYRVKQPLREVTYQNAQFSGNSEKRRRLARYTACRTGGLLRVCRPARRAGFTPLSTNLNPPCGLPSCFPALYIYTLLGHDRCITPCTAIPPPSKCTGIPRFDDFETYLDLQTFIAVFNETFEKALLRISKQIIIEAVPKLRL